MPPHPNTLRPLLRLRLAATCAKRRFASSLPPKPATKPQGSSQPSFSRTIPQRPGGQIDHSLPPDSANKQFYAAKLYAAGQREIYRPRSHAGVLGASYIIAASCFITSGALAFSNLWAYDADSGFHWVVRVGYRLGIITFTALGCIALLRPINLIRSIDLVSSDGVVKLLVQVRRPIPFMRPKQYLIPPYEFRMDRTFVQQMEEPEFVHEDAPRPKGVLSRIAQSISRAIWYPFAATRTLMTLEGIMSVTLTEEGTKAKLDSQGKFSNHGEDIVRMGTIVL
ncbi:hypothetical protein PV05_05753 [Exophiala xenobiotica]|uniref:Uncharacterized protein n=1 Tax=Exophiala xenobiotica TaxID=348802 RepID=A0A0D2D475_9EURO|nr:uncharacterized protein PV05_05753 [Exophiala xenobiotica]KIW57162.1 hypothetical protein PV05_05753 [Exophiala xenobiotica]